jgi:hypothetical protein
VPSSSRPARPQGRWSGTSHRAASVRAPFDDVAGEHKKLAVQLLEGLARGISARLRRANTELRALQEG